MVGFGWGGRVTVGTRLSRVEGRCPAHLAHLISSHLIAISTVISSSLRSDYLLLQEEALQTVRPRNSIA